MSKKKDKAASALETELAEVKEEIALLDLELTAERERSSQGMAARADNLTHKKRLEVIGHITAGRVNEAIQAILEPIPMIFQMDVRFADDKSRIAAEEQMLEQVVARVVKHVEGLRLKRDKEDGKAK